MHTWRSYPIGMGAPTKLTPERHDKIVAYVRDGLFAEQAAIAAGVSGGTYYLWMSKGRGGPGDPEPTSPYAEFYEAIKKAEADCEAESIKAIRTAGRTTWTAHAWYLERKYPHRYGRKVQEITGADGGPIQVSADKPLTQLNELLAKLAPTDDDDEGEEDGS